MGATGPVVLCILDGVGIGDGGPDDAVQQADTPTLDRLMTQWPWMSLAAHGTAVGLPSDSDMGNSEVGHNAMGAGRVFDQGAKLVNHAIASGVAWDTPIWRDLVATKTLHLMGLVSDGNVHSHIDHLWALIHRAVADGATRIRVHVLTDGRDVAAKSALTWIEPLEELLSSLPIDASVASGGGRMFITMDRYNADWAMVERGWRCHVLGEGRGFSTATEAVRAAYAEDPEIDDQYLPPFVITDAQGQPKGTINNGDGVLFFNFRGDRAVEISRAFEEGDDTFPYFDRVRRPLVVYAGMMQYDGDLRVPSRFLVEPPQIEGTVGELLAAHGKRSFVCSETQKFGHVTFFFNGNRSGYIDEALETYVEIPSDTGSFDETPWMKAAEITDAAVEALASGAFDHIRLNYANGDMVGHTGQLKATRLAIEAVDQQLERLDSAVQAANGILLVTADHGNADEMWTHRGGRVVRDAKGKPLPRTSHTLNPVPFVLVGGRGGVDDWCLSKTADAGIASVGSTVLMLCGVPVPADWKPSLVSRRK